jgi:N-dimethylarginine dimethylaminohydrolase
MWKIKKIKKRFICSAVSCVNRHLPHDPSSKFQIAWEINPHMKKGATSFSVAVQEHHRFITALKFTGADVHEVPFIRGAYDSVFMKDSAIVKAETKQIKAFLATFKTNERATETQARARALEKLGVTVCGQATTYFEGGDFVDTCSDFSFLGYGFRTDKDVSSELSDFMDKEVIPLEIVDPHFYHLDTALNATIMDENCYVFAYRNAFSENSWKLLQSLPSINLVEVSRKEAMLFGLNWVESDNTIILGSFVPEIMDHLRLLGKSIVHTPLTQFQLAGGSAACLVSQVYESPDTPRVYENIEVQRKTPVYQRSLN